MILKKIKLVKKIIIFILSKFDYRHSHLPGLSLIEYYRLKHHKTLKAGETKFFKRKFKFSDNNGFLHSLDEIYKQEIYKFHSINNTPYIIDCGANIGVSVFYFKRLYPTSKIVAFEPDNDIYKILESNIKTSFNDGSVKLRKEAVWIKNEELTFFSDGSLAGSTVVDFSSNNKRQKVQAVDLNKYLNQEVDFLKIDIEGAENELIFHISENLKNVKNLFLEYHGLLNQSQNLGDILNLISSVGFEYYIRVAGETIQFPFCEEQPKVFNQQLNILCYRKTGLNSSK